MIDVREYIDRNGGSLYTDWFDQLNAHAAAQVATALTRLAAGNSRTSKALVLECLSTESISVLGYRVDFGKDGERLVSLLGGGTKKRQPQDISAAPANWLDYKRRR